MSICVLTSLFICLRRIFREQRNAIIKEYCTNDCIRRDKRSINENTSNK